MFPTIARLLSLWNPEAIDEGADGTLEWWTWLKPNTFGGAAQDSQVGGGLPGSMHDIL
jgi:hypothetical protein